MLQANCFRFYFRSVTVIIYAKMVAFPILTDPLSPGLKAPPHLAQARNTIHSAEPLAADGHVVSGSVARHLMGRSSKCVKVVKRPVLTAVASLVRGLFRTAVAIFCRLLSRWVVVVVSHHSRVSRSHITRQRSAAWSGAWRCSAGWPRDDCQSQGHA